MAHKAGVEKKPTCSYCGTLLVAGTAKCQRCGTPVSRAAAAPKPLGTTTRGRRRNLVPALLVLALLGAGAVVVVAPADVDAMCWLTTTWDAECTFTTPAPSFIPGRRCVKMVLYRAGGDDPAGAQPPGLRAGVTTACSGFLWGESTITVSARGFSQSPEKFCATRDACAILIEDPEYEPKDTPPPIADAPPAKAQPETAPSATDSIGVPECDRYLAQATKCSDKLGTAAGELRSTIDEIRKTWKDIASTPEGKQALASACRDALEALRTTMRPLGCTW